MIVPQPLPARIREQTEARLRGCDLAQLRQEARDWRNRLTPDSPELIRRRSHLETEGTGQSRALERILGGNELLHVNYLTRGARSADAVARIRIRDAAGELLGYGTGFLVAPRVLLTNHHVAFADPADPRRFAAGSLAEFGFELGAAGAPARSATFRIERLLAAGESLDFAFVLVAPQSLDGRDDLARFGQLPLIRSTGKVVKGEWVSIIQHPNGDLKQVALRENELVSVGDDFLTYLTDTAPGSSGAPVFNDSWQVIALHHSAVPSQDGNGWVANEGVRISRIVAALAARREAGESWLRTVLEPSTATGSGAPPPAIASADGTSDASAAPSAARVLSRVGTIDLCVPLHVSLSLGAPPAAAPPAAPPPAPTAPPAPAPGIAVADDGAEAVAIDPDYSTRRGYSRRFLGKSASLQVPLPDYSKHVARLSINQRPMGGPPHVLDYHHFSTVHHKQRRIALFTAVNIDGRNHHWLEREKDAWYFDPRIPRAEQLGNDFYARNRLDRGHLVRRLDPAWGPNESAAKVANDDTFHFTNCSPQHERFNQNQSTWAGVEDLLLEKAVDEERRMSVFTGPVLRANDRSYRDAQLPSRYWKVVALAGAHGKLIAAAFVLSQRSLLSDLEADFDAGTFRTFQVRVQDVERLTELSFGRLRDCDVLGGSQEKFEATGGGGIAIDSIDDLVA